MEIENSKIRPLHSIAEDYFSYLGRHLPQQCASDEFYFFPRSEAAEPYLNLLDDPDPGRLQDHIQYLKTLIGEIREVGTNDLEDEIDKQLLRQSIGGLIREWEGARVWQKDPTLYVKIPLFALARVLMTEDETMDRLRSDLLSIFSQLPPYLSLSIKNLDSPSEISLEVARDMTLDAIGFHERDIVSFIRERLGEDEELLSKNRAMSKAWDGFGHSLTRLQASPRFAVGEDLLREILSGSFGYNRPLDEILVTAQSAQDETQARLRTLGRSMGREAPRPRGSDDGISETPSEKEVVRMYRREVQKLRRFFYKQDCLPLPIDERVTVRETPAYLRSLRATASYSAPLTGHPRDAGTFYITPGKGDHETSVAHCSYLSAHETYPGHHLLDHFRIHHHNPVRRQIESPLFYEGWACYGEQLLDELGYISDPRHQTIGLKRQLWRNLRAKLDIKLQTGKIGFDQAVLEIESLGYSRPRAQRQVRRFCLTPGYQLCYFVGMHEIIQLRKHHESRIGTKRFHERLLGGGEIPFDLTEKRLKEVLHEAG